MTETLQASLPGMKSIEGPPQYDDITPQERARNARRRRKDRPKEAPQKKPVDPLLRAIALLSTEDLARLRRIKATAILHCGNKGIGTLRHETLALLIGPGNRGNAVLEVIATTVLYSEHIDIRLDPGNTFEVRSEMVVAPRKKGLVKQAK